MLAGSIYSDHLWRSGVKEISFSLNNDFSAAWHSGSDTACKIKVLNVVSVSAVLHLGTDFLHVPLMSTTTIQPPTACIE